MMNKNYKKNLGGRKDKNTILIDTGSTFSCVNNPQLLINIRKSGKPISGVSNGGVMKSDMEGDIPGWFTAYYNPNSLMNILSIQDVRKKFRVTMDTVKANAIIIHLAEGKVMKFLETSNGLYVWKPCDGTNLNKKQVSLYSFFTLVEANKNNFTRREVVRADECKKQYT